MVLTLLVITLISSSLVGVVYRMTLPMIEQSRNQKVRNAVAMVLPQFDNDPIAEKRIVMIDGQEAAVYPATKGGQPVGYAIETFTNNGFAGLITLMVGFDAEGRIYRVETLSHSETPGLGDKIERNRSDFSLQFEGQDPRTFSLRVRKDGGDVDAITASTITSRAYTEAVERAFRIFKSL